MFKLKFIEIGPFRSFQEPQRIEFPENGMFLIQGENLDTGGSSGSGKSNFLIAIEYVFGSCPFPSTVLSPWQQPDVAPTVKLGIITDKGLVELKRAKKLEITEDGVEFKGSADQKNEYLQKIIGLSPEVRQALTYRGQKTPGLFLNKANADKTDFLIPLLDLVRFEKAQVIGDTQYKALAEKLAETNAAYRALEGGIVAPDESLIIEVQLRIKEHNFFMEGVTEELVSKEKAQNEARRANKDEAQAAQYEYGLVNHLEDLKTELNTLQTNAPVFNLDNREFVKLNEDMVELQKRLDRVITEDNERRQKYEEVKRGLNTKIQNAASKMDGRGLEQNKKKILQEIEILKSNKCPTCSREWLTTQDKVAELEKSLEEINQKLHKCLEAFGFYERFKAQLEEIPQFESDVLIAKFTAIKEGLAGKIATEKQKINSAKSLFDAKFAKQVAEVRQQISAVVIAGENISKEVKNQFKPIEEQFAKDIQALQVQKQELLQKLSSFKIELATLQANKKHYDNQQKQLELKLIEKTHIESELNVETDLDKLIGKEGFLGSIFDEVLQEISDETNNTLAGIANTRHVTLQFQSETETKKGTIRKNIIPVVTVGGFTAPIKSALSGGMASTVELAVDLAIGEVISRRTGIVPGYLMLDECFDGLDDVSKESCFELLRVYSKDRLILVIDHSSELKALFEKVITIQFKDGCSTVADMV